LLVTWMKFRLSMMKKYRANKASSKIAATYKMYLQVKILESCTNAVVKIQSHQRKIAAKLVARKLRDPFCGMSHKELKELLRSEMNCLENAVDSKDFKRAANIEEKVYVLNRKSSISDNISSIEYILTFCQCLLLMHF
jgi:hypothetical protein